MRNMNVPSGLTAGSLLSKIEKMVRQSVDAITPFRATVSSIDPLTNMVSIIPVNATTPTEEYFSRIAGDLPAVGSEVACILLGGKPFIIGSIARLITKNPFFPRIDLGDLYVNEKLLQTVVPTMVLSTGAGTAPTLPVVNGSDTFGKLSFTTGTVPVATAGTTVATITTQLDSNVDTLGVLLFGNNAISQIDIGCVYANKSTTNSWRIRTTGLRALATSTAYEFTYIRFPIIYIV